MKPQQHSKPHFLWTSRVFPKLITGMTGKSIALWFFQMQIFGAAIKTKHNRVSIKRMTIGWSSLLKIPVSCCDHPKSVSHHWYSAGIASPFFLLSDFPTWMLRQSGSAHPPECKRKHFLNPKESKNYLSMIICFIAPKSCTSLYCWEGGFAGVWFRLSLSKQHSGCHPQAPLSSGSLLNRFKPSMPFLVKCLEVSEKGFLAFNLQSTSCPNNWRAHPGIQKLVSVSSCAFHGLSEWLWSSFSYYSNNQNCNFTQQTLAVSYHWMSGSPILH